MEIVYGALVIAVVVCVGLYISIIVDDGKVSDCDETM